MTQPKPPIMPWRHRSIDGHWYDVERTWLIHLVRLARDVHELEKPVCIDLPYGREMCIRPPSRSMANPARDWAVESGGRWGFSWALQRTVWAYTSQAPAISLQGVGR
ncbi:hypothetical protein GCM10009560_48280 [Nonomuraea longicatena]|uniref:Uncharacterized protein n=1 Tax=Nonomuraea longicatena TaxID=83682 RepID=A0ABP4ALT6_9ACTN